MSSSDDETVSEQKIQADADKQGPLTDGDVRPLLTMLTGGDVGRSYVLEKMETLVGRSDDCDIQVLEPTVSRRHARFVATPDGVEVFDLKSSNGLLINGHRIQRHWLKDKDIISLGDRISFRFACVTGADLRQPEQVFGSAALSAFPGGSQEMRFKLALITAAVRLREETHILDSLHSQQLLHTAKLLEAMAGEKET